MRRGMREGLCDCEERDEGGTMSRRMREGQ